MSKYEPKGIQLEEVYLEEFMYPCVLYAKRRVGILMSLQDIYSLEGLPYENTNQLSVGDIVVWERFEEEDTDMTLSMGGRGPITTKVALGRHFAVYEGDGMVSDICFDAEHYFPRIRLTLLEERKRPKNIIKYTMVLGAVGNE